MLLLTDPPCHPCPFSAARTHECWEGHHHWLLWPDSIVCSALHRSWLPAVCVSAQFSSFCYLWPHSPLIPKPQLPNTLALLPSKLGLQLQYGPHISLVYTLMSSIIIHLLHESCYPAYWELQSCFSWFAHWLSSCATFATTSFAFACHSDLVTIQFIGMLLSLFFKNIVVNTLYSFRFIWLYNYKNGTLNRIRTNQ